jgi:hypothetical protein
LFGRRSKCRKDSEVKAYYICLREVGRLALYEKLQELNSYMIYYLVMEKN